MKYICVLLLFLSFKSDAQNLLTKYPAIKYDSVAVKISGNSYKKDYQGVAIYKKYKIVLLGNALPDSAKILLYYNNRIIKKTIIKVNVSTLLFNYPIYIADIDGNGFPDFKIVMQNACCGGGGDYALKVYLLNKGDNHFYRISFYDLFSNKEQDFNNDGKYEIIGEHFAAYKSNYYDVMDIYAFSNVNLINVSRKYGYPKADIDYTYRNYHPSLKITKKELYKLSYPYPEDYSHD